MRFQWIHRHRNAWPIAVMCRVLRVSRSGYYARCGRPTSAMAERRKQLLTRIRRVFERSGCTYGSPRIHHWLCQHGVRCNVKTVATLMRQNGLKSCMQRRFKVVTTDSRHGYRAHQVPAVGLLDRRFGADRPDQRWACDITYIPTGEGWLYLAVVLDLFSRRVVGWACADHLRASLAVDALTMAIDRRKRGADALVGLLHHSDRGVQYACDAYRALLEAHGITASMSRTGNCYDNATTESFFGTLKMELTHHHRYTTRTEAIASIGDYIENWSNTQRLHSSLNYVSPQTYELNYERMTA